MYFQKRRLTVSIRRKVTPGHPGWIWFVQCPDLICLAAHWSGPATSARRLSAILRVRQSLLDSFSSLEIFIGFYIWCYPISTIHSMFIYRWSSNFVETLSWKESNGGRDAISCLLPCVLYCMEGEFEQIISKIRLSKGQQQLTAE